MKEKGQALVEFILILPIILLVFLALIDIGNIFTEKYDLNNELEIISEMYQNNVQEAKAYAALEDLILTEETNGNMLTLNLEKEIEISAPILKNVLGENYKIKASKTVYVGDANE